MSWETENDVVNAVLETANFIPSTDNLLSGLEKLSTQTGAALTKILPMLGEKEKVIVEKLRPVLEKLKISDGVDFTTFVKQDLPILTEDTGDVLSIIKNLPKTSFAKNLDVEDLVVELSGVDASKLKDLKVAKFNLQNLSRGSSES